MKHLLMVPFLACALFSQACIIVDDGGGTDSSLTIQNDSSYALWEIYVSPINAATWGSNLLGGTALYPGEALTVGLDCDTYDALVVDEDGFECTLYGLDLCFEDAVWYIDNVDLNTCGFAGINESAATLDKQSRPDESAAVSEAAL